MMSTNPRTSERRWALPDRGGIRAVAAVTALIVFGLGNAALAQSVFDFDEWMESIDKRTQSVQRNLAAGDAMAATADAQEIGKLYGSMETFFARRGGADNAVKLSKEGKEWAASVVSSVAVQDFAAAAKAAVTIAKACRTCHLEYKPLE